MLSFRWISKTAETELPRHVGYSLRFDSPYRSHSFAGNTCSRIRIERKHRSTLNYWRRGPRGPGSSKIVLITGNEWKLQPQRVQCGAPDCENFPPKGPETTL